MNSLYNSCGGTVSPSWRACWGTLEKAAGTSSSSEAAPAAPAQSVSASGAGDDLQAAKAITIQQGPIVFN